MSAIPTDDVILRRLWFLDLAECAGVRRRQAVILNLFPFKRAFNSDRFAPQKARPASAFA